MGNDQKRAFIAVILSGFILFFWQFYFAPKVSPQPKNVPVAEVQNNNTPTSLEQEEEKNEVQLESVIITNENTTIKFNNQLAFSNITSLNSDSSLKAITGVGSSLSFFFKNNDTFAPLLFSISKINENEASFVNVEKNISGSLKIVDGRANLTLTTPVLYQINFNSKPQEKYGQFRQFAYYTEDLNLIKVDDEDKDDAKMQWLGVDFDYHLFGLSLKNQTNFVLDVANNKATFTYTGTENTHEMEILLVKKEYDFLTKLGNNLKNSVDFGWWSIIAVPILRGLQFFYTVIPNYGIGIIILTLLMRLITFPLQYKSIKSMKKLQEIQPELTKIREKFKSDPQRLQKESMELFKKSGANPLGGCLPLLLQMPVFFAFYKVLYSSVELVNSPFYFWITDLSQKDPYYVLPILMSITMFIQQKITPSTTADPMQKKILLFMPLIFGFIMKDLPAGLTLYIFISTLLGIVQQVAVFRKA
jgi:YidC/Oxa1 family membrane protein insertase